MTTRARPTRELRDATITIRLPSSLRDAVERRAKRERRSIADVIIFAVEAAVKGSK